MNRQTARIVICLVLFGTFAYGKSVDTKANDSSSQHQTGNASSTAVGGTGGNISLEGVGNNNKNDANIHVANDGGKGGNVATSGGKEVHNDTDTGGESFQGGSASSNVSGGQAGNTAIKNSGNGNNNTNLDAHSNGGASGSANTTGGEARSKGKQRHHGKGSNRHYGKPEDYKSSEKVY